MHVSALGEFGLIERLAARLADQPSGSLVLGIGDDAAAWKPAADRLSVATADSLVEGVHFDLATTSWEDLGWKALAENLSDIAAMGCSPRYALISLALPPRTQVADVEALYAGIHHCASAFACQIVGGDTVRAPLVVLSITVVGESEPAIGEDAPILTRSSARPGDQIAVTGPLGASAAGLRLLRDGADATNESTAALLGAHRRPNPRIEAGLALVRAGVRCAIDVSDGLLADIGHICERSDVDAEVRASDVPVHPAAAAQFGAAARDLALRGGEDYELVCVASAERLEAAGRRLAELGEPPLTVIGSIMKKKASRPTVFLQLADGTRAPTGTGGYAHFTSEA